MALDCARTVGPDKRDSLAGFTLKLTCEARAAGCVRRYIAELDRAVSISWVDRCMAHSVILHGTSNYVNRALRGHRALHYELLHRQGPVFGSKKKTLELEEKTQPSRRHPAVAARRHRPANHHNHSFAIPVRLSTRTMNCAYFEALRWALQSGMSLIKHRA